MRLNTFTLHECGGAWWSNDVCAVRTDTYSFTGVFIEESSPVAFSQFIEFSENDKYLYFSWLVSSGGDGDWFSLFFGDQLIWSMGIDQLFEGILNYAYVDISAFAGMSGDLIFSLSSVGERNVALYLGDLTVPAPTSQVPIPPASALMMTGLVGLFAIARRKQTLRIGVAP